MRRLLVLALVLVAPAVRAAPDASPELAALVPPRTLLLVECNDLDGKGRFGEGTSIGKLLAEPEVRRFVSKLDEALRKAFAANARGPLSMLGLAPEDFDGILWRRAGFALVEVSLPAEQVDAVLYLETRAGGEKVAKILKGLRAAAETFAGIAFTESDVRGRKVVSTNLEGHELCIAAQGDRFVLTTLRARMEEVLKAIDEGHAHPLRADPRMGKVRERMGAGRNALFAYMNVPALASTAIDLWAAEDPEDAADARRICSALGLDAVEAAAFADVPEGTGYRTEGALLLKERRGLFALAASAPPSHRFAKMVPANALAYGAETCDFAALWDGILALAGSIDARARGALEQGERAASAVVGLDLRKDLLLAFGTEWAGYVGWPAAGGLLPDVVLFASVRDRERLLRSLDALAAKAGEVARGMGASVALCRTEFRGTEICFLEVTDRRGEPRPYAPAWALGEDFAVFALWPQSVKHALMERFDRIDSRVNPDGGDPLLALSLAGNTRFEQLLAAAPRGAVSATYVDLGRIVAWVYATAVPFLQMAQAAVHRPDSKLPGALRVALSGFRLNFEDLPPADVVARHLGGLLCYTSVEPDCVRIGFVSQFGAPLAVVPVAMAAGAAAVLLSGRRVVESRAVVQHEETVRRARAMEAAQAEEAALLREAQRLREENAMLRQRLARLEEQVAELRRLAEEKSGDRR